MRLAKVIQVLLTATCAVALAGLACAQIVQPPSYSDAYKQEYQRSRRSYQSPASYTFNKYFYHRPSVSPYINLSRPSGPYTNNYRSYVVPEQERRIRTKLSEVDPQKAQAWRTQIQGVQQSLGMGTAAPRSQGSTPGHYYNRWYSGRERLGLK